MATLITTIGLTKINNATPLDQLNITQMAIGDGNGGTPSHTVSDTSLNNEVYRTAASTPIRDPENPDHLIFDMNIPDDIRGFTVREVGLFDVDGDLIAVGATQVTEKGPDSRINLTERMVIRLQNANDVEVIYSSAPPNDYEERLQDIEGKYAQHMTLSEAQSSDLREGQYVRLTDKHHALYKVVTGSGTFTAGEKYLQIVIENGVDVHVEAFGVSDTQDSTSAIITALNSGASLIGDPNKFYLYNTATKAVVTKHVRQRDFNISFGVGFDGYILEYQQSVQSSNCIYEFNNNSYCDLTGRAPAPIAYLGKLLIEDNVEYRNIRGVQDRFQYAYKVLHNTKTESNGTLFKNIEGVTNTAETSGFCGGAFVATDPDNLGNVTRSSHEFNNTVGINVKTIANSNAVTVPDSDLIRYYAYEYESVGTYPDAEAAVERSLLKVTNQYCKNVLKSALKASNIKTEVDGGQFYVDDTNDQSLIYAAYRYQQGKEFNCNNITVVGSNIANAVLAAGKKSRVSNINFDSNYSTATAVFCGSNGDEDINVENVYTDDCAYILQLSASANVTAYGLYNEGGLRTHVVRYLNPTKAKISHVRVKPCSGGLLDSFNTSSSFESLTFEDTRMESTTVAGLISQHDGAGSLIIESSFFSGTFSRIIVGGTGLTEFICDATKFETTSTNTNQILADFNGVAIVHFVNGSKIVDSRGDKLNSVIRVRGNKELKFADFEYKGTASGVGITFLDAVGDGSGDFTWSDSKIESVDPMGNTIVATGYRVARLNDVGLRMPNDLNGVIDLTGNTASSVDGLYGNIKASGAVVGADSVINEVKLA